MYLKNVELLIISCFVYLVSYPDSDRLGPSTTWPERLAVQPGVEGEQSSNTKAVISTMRTQWVARGVGY